MSTMSKIAFAVFTLGFVFNFLETWYFGWNWKAGSVAEGVCNNLSSTLIIIGFCMMLFYRNQAAQ